MFSIDYQYPERVPTCVSLRFDPPREDPMNQYSGPPPGWYPVNAGAELWWWDGYRWIQPEPEPEAVVATRTAASWLIALLPVVVTVIAAALLVGDVRGPFVLTALGLGGFVLLPISVGLSFWDVTTLRSRGSTIALLHALWILLGGWVYLLVRALLLKGSDRERWVLLGVSFATGLLTSAMFIAGFIATVTDEGFRRDIFYQQSVVERTIARDISDRAGLQVQVECPDDPPIGEGDSFDCSVDNESGQMLGVATVTWTNDFGAFTWEAHPGGAPSSPQT
jgi:hypothetical protein